MRRLILTIGGVAILSFGTACGKQDAGTTDTGHAVVPDSDSTNASANGSSCNVGYGVANPCKNMLPANFFSDLTPAQRYDAIRRVVYNPYQFGDVKRKLKDPNCKKSPPKHKARAAKESRFANEPLDWPNASIVSMVEFKTLEEDECPDFRYHVGGKKDDQPQEFFLVALVDNSLRREIVTEKGDTNTVIGRWITLETRMVSGTRVIDSANGGLLVVCGRRHKKPPMTGFADFQKCSEKRYLHDLAASRDDSLESILGVVHSFRTGGNASASANLAPFTPADSAQLRRIARNLEENPVWVTCGVGCCIAEDKDYDGTGDRMSQSPSPRSLMRRAPAYAARLD